MTGCFPLRCVSRSPCATRECDVYLRLTYVVLSYVRIRSDSWRDVRCRRVMQPDLLLQCIADWCLSRQSTAPVVRKKRGGKLNSLGGCWTFTVWSLCLQTLFHNGFSFVDECVVVLHEMTTAFVNALCTVLKLSSNCLIRHDKVVFLSQLSLILSLLVRVMIPWHSVGHRLIW